MLASEHLLTEAWEQSTDDALRAYYLKHLLDERDHARWLAADLDTLGIEKVFDFRSAALAGLQYYLIYHRDPALLLGYMLVLEGWPKPPEILDNLEERYGPLRSLRYHAEHDPAHTEELRAIIASQPPATQAAIRENAEFVRTWLLAVAATMPQEAPF